MSRSRAGRVVQLHAWTGLPELVNQASGQLQVDDCWAKTMFGAGCSATAGQWPASHLVTAKHKTEAKRSHDRLHFTWNMLEHNITYSNNAMEGNGMLPVAPSA